MVLDKCLKSVCSEPSGLEIESNLKSTLDVENPRKLPNTAISDETVFKYWLI